MKYDNKRFLVTVIGFGENEAFKKVECLGDFWKPKFEKCTSKPVLNSRNELNTKGYYFIVIDPTTIFNICFTWIPYYYFFG